jgi:hypothetical protein
MKIIVLSDSYDRILEIMDGIARDFTDFHIIGYARRKEFSGSTLKIRPNTTYIGLNINYTLRGYKANMIICDSMLKDRVIKDDNGYIEAMVRYSSTLPKSLRIVYV